MVTTLELTQLEAMLQDFLGEQENVMLARNYFNGVQEVYLTARAQEFLGLHGDANTFKLNVCRTIVTAVANELNLIGFDTNEKTDGTKPKEQAAWAMEVYKKNKLDSLQDAVHESALADSETFVIVEWDAEQKYPRMIHNPRFVDVDAGGDGMGAWMVYENDDPNQKPIAGVKQWIETTWTLNGTATSEIRRTLYYPDRIERWVYRNATWQHFIEIDEEWPIPWVDKQGEPLGIPVFHFKNKGIRAEHWDAIPMQDAVNKQLVDILAAGDLTAFKSLFGFGFYPTIDGKEPKADGSNVMKMGPAQFNGTLKAPDQASLEQIEGADVGPLVETLVKLVLFTAQITDTPASKFVVTAAIASEKTIKEQDAALKKKATDRRGLFGDSWTGVINMARKLANLNGNAMLNEDVQFIPVWEHTETLEELGQKRQTLNIPLEQLWIEAGYTPEQIAAMKATPEYRATFEKALWEGYNAASQSGIPLETYLKRVGVPEAEIKIILDDMANQSGVPATNL
jgi:hypothetical protein